MLVFSGCAEKSEQAQTEISESKPTKEVLSTEDSLKMKEVSDDTKNMVDNTQEYHNMIIGSNHIGGVKVGMAKEEIEALGYTIEEGQRQNSSYHALEGEMDDVWVVSDDLGERLQVLYSENVGSWVYVSSDMVQTEKTAYLGMSIEAFLTSHPNAQLHYHFIGNDVWFSVPELENIDFRIALDHVIEIETIEYDGSKNETTLPIEQANPKGTIMEIRLTHPVSEED